MRLIIQDRRTHKILEPGECFVYPKRKGVAYVNIGGTPLEMFEYFPVEADSGDVNAICESAGPSDAWTPGQTSRPRSADMSGLFCGLYGTCNGNAMETEGWTMPCLHSCKVNGKPPPTVTWNISGTWRSPSKLLPSAVAPSINAGRTISMVPAWLVPGGHSDLYKHEFLDGLDGGYTIVVERSVRAAGTRAVLHAHDWGGVTCIQRGEMTLLLDGLEDAITVHEGGCYWMPPKRYMSGMNTGNVSALHWDFFILPAESTVDLTKYPQGVVYLTPKELFEESNKTIAAIDADCEMTAPPDNPLEALLPASRPCGCIVKQNQTDAMPLEHCVMHPMMNS